MATQTETSPFRCEACDAAYVSRVLNAGEVECGACGAGAEVRIFHALLKKVEPGAAPQALVLDDESSCFYHPKKKAEIPCEHCGRFLCALCDIEIHGNHLCAPCVEAGAATGQAEDVAAEYVQYDTIALSLALWPMLFFFWPTLFTAPATLFFVVRYWRRKLSVLPRRRWRFVVAGVIALAQIAVWASIFMGISGSFLTFSSGGAV